MHKNKIRFDSKLDFLHWNIQSWFKILEQNIQNKIQNGLYKTSPLFFEIKFQNW